MKDSEFIELLNLYLDHEISAADAARVEAEVQQNPARRRVYQDYCRIQKACMLLAKDYVEQAAATRLPEDKKIVAFEPRRTWGTGVYLGGLAVAAACVALVLVNRSSQVAPLAESTKAPVAQNSNLSAPVIDVNTEQPALVTGSAPRAFAQTVTVPARRSELKPVFTASSLTLANPNANDREVLAAAEQDASQAQFDWIRTVQLLPVQRVPVDAFRFESKTELKPVQRTFGPGRLQIPAENAAWQFQR